MKGIILAGGTGSRLYPATKVLNKHIIPLYDKPVIYYPLSILMLSGIRDIIIVCNSNEYNNYYKLLGDGSNLGIFINYVFQKEPKGIIDGVLLCKDYILNDGTMVVLGDNFFYGQAFINILRKAIQNNRGATMFSIFRNYDYTITTIKYNENKKPISLKRKDGPINQYISPGLFVYDKDLYDIVNNLETIDGEKEWVSVNSEYLKRGTLDVINLDRGMFWFDVGTANARLDAEILIAQVQQKEGFYIGCIEEIAYRQSWIGKEKLEAIIFSMKGISYKNYLVKVLNMPSLLD